MDFEITSHAIERMKKYSISQDLLKDTLQKPDSVEKSYKERTIYQKKLNGYVLRVIVEEGKEIKTVVTVYKARSSRYEI